ncbi:MAG: hypothetical protein KKG60_03505 [Nanoarchaeota archaeon]|nr:hypothetical protein [Nanoarchaeota archaeon]
MRKKGKGQSAMEFVITYGWAVLIVIIAFGILFYLGVFSSKAGNACTSPAPLSCRDVKLENDGALTIVSGIAGASSARITQILLQSPMTRTINEEELNSLLSENGRELGETINELTIPLGIDNIKSGQKFSGTVIVEYSMGGSSLTHLTTIEFSGKVEDATQKTHFGCVSNTCTLVSGSGIDECDFEGERCVIIPDPCDFEECGTFECKVVDGPFNCFYVKITPTERRIKVIDDGSVVKSTDPDSVNYDEGGNPYYCPTVSWGEETYNPGIVNILELYSCGSPTQGVRIGDSFSGVIRIPYYTELEGVENWARLEFSGNVRAS